MDADEVLTGKKKEERQQEDPIADALYWHRHNPLTKEEMESLKTKGIAMPNLNPRPFVKVFDVHKRASNKLGKGLMVGLQWAF